jgi:hypothetical protein
MMFSIDFHQFFFELYFIALPLKQFSNLFQPLSLGFKQVSILFNYFFHWCSAVVALVLALALISFLDFF